MEKRWKITPVPEESQILQLSSSLNVSPPIASILLQRNINTFDAAKTYFRPSLNDLHDPFLMADMDKAVLRLKKAFEKNEKILVYGDYDVDGTTSVSLVYGFLRKKYSQMDFYIPDRYKEGYGISEAGILWAKESDFTLIVSLDCGIKSVDKIELANSLGVDFIICDHHNPGEILPDAAAVLDPKRIDCLYPYKELSGCGVGFKLLQAIVQEMNWDKNELLSCFDLLAISIASDIVPITGENRVMTNLGIAILNSKINRPGVKALIDLAGFKRKIDVSNVVFGIGPRINAAGRIAHAKTAVQLLLAEDEKEAENFASLINEKNLVRKDFDSTITDEALTMINEDVFLQNSKSTVLYKQDWHKGVIGIVASRCIEKFYRPTIILTESNGKATGSARSVDGFDLYEAIVECSDLLVQFGGHTHAAGLTMELTNLEAFRKRFEEVVSSTITPEQQIPFITIDLKLSLEQINRNFFDVLQQMGPFGPHNMQPVFYSEGFTDNGESRVLKEKHLKLKLKQGKSDLIDAIGFDMGHLYGRIKTGEPFDVCYQISENEYNGKTTLQLLIKEIRFNSGR